MLNPNKDGLLETYVSDGKNQIINLAAEVNMSQAISKTCLVSIISTGRQPPPLSSVLYRIISERCSVLAAQLFLREKSGA
jgi:hypothetical protein